jgi:polysaccharide biosynthesis/export protein
MKQLSTLLLALAMVTYGAEPYVIGPGDRLQVRLRDIKELEFAPATVELDGAVEFAYTGRMLASGMTADDLAREVENRLRRLVRDPKVTVEVVEYGSQPVSVLGAVRKPGLHQLRGGRTLSEVLALAEGLTPEAGNSLSITRSLANGPIPLANAVLDETGKYSVALVSLKKLTDGSNPQLNILVRPNDVISVARSEIVYVVGNVKKPGGFALLDRETVSVLQALALAEGLDPTADAKHTRILRNSREGGARQEILLDMSRILSNKAPDRTLEPNDILFIPNSTVKSAGRRVLDMAVQMATGVVIFGR